MGNSLAKGVSYSLQYLFISIITLPFTSDNYVSWSYSLLDFSISLQSFGANVKKQISSLMNLLICVSMMWDSTILNGGSNILKSINHCSKWLYALMMNSTFGCRITEPSNVIPFPLDTFLALALHIFHCSPWPLALNPPPLASTVPLYSPSYRLHRSWKLKYQLYLSALGDILNYDWKPHTPSHYLPLFTIQGHFLSHTLKLSSCTNWGLININCNMYFGPIESVAYQLKNDAIWLWYVRFFGTNIFISGVLLEYDIYSVNQVPFIHKQTYQRI